MVAYVARVAKKYQFQSLGSRNPQRSRPETCARFSTTGVVFGVVREGLPAPDEPAEARLELSETNSACSASSIFRCWHCNVKGNHLLGTLEKATTNALHRMPCPRLRCSNWAWSSNQDARILGYRLPLCSNLCQHARGQHEAM